ncbi:MAG: type IV pilus assembly protein PilM [Deinococcaceae bacterium]
MSDFFRGLLNTRIDAIGLEIGTSAIKVVELRPGSPPTLVKAVSIPTPAGTIQDGMVVDPPAVAQEIKNLLAEHKIKSRYVVTTIPNQSAITRNISVPKMEKKELDEAIQWEAERYIPYPIEDVVLDYDFLDDPAELIDDDSQMELVIAAAPREVISRQVEVIKLAGLDPVVIDVKAFSVMRALFAQINGGMRPDKHTTAIKATLEEEGDATVILEIGASSTTIALVRRERVLMTRNIGISADDFTTTLQKQFNLNFVSAEDVKINYASATLPTDEDEDLLNFEVQREKYSPMKVYECIRPVVSDLINEIRRSLEFYRVQSGEVIVDRMYLSGGGGKLKGLDHAIGDAMGFHVELGNPWVSVNAETSKWDSAALQKIGAEFVVPLGLALRGVSGLD